MIRRLLVLVAVLLAAMWIPLARAHDFGAMLVTLDVRADGVVQGVIRVDPQHLPLEHSKGFFSTSAIEVAGAIDRVRGELSGSAKLLTSAGAGERFETGSGVTWDIELDPGTSPKLLKDGLLLLSFEFRPPTHTASIAWSCSAPLGRYLIRVQQPGQSEPSAQWLNPGEMSDAILIEKGKPAHASHEDVWTTYIALGFTHIIPGGFDHILFILGLFFMSARMKWILSQATAFTLAHSLTLALAASSVIHPAPRVVEPLIALSIAVIGVENIIVRRPNNRHVAMAFAFGLLHGLGFAGALSDIGLPEGRLIPALAAFNIGVELGQISVILAAFVLIGSRFQDRPWYRARVVIPGSVAIASVALVWTVHRL